MSVVDKPENQSREKPQQLRDFEDALLVTIILFTFVTWVIVLLRMLTG
jgi:hypothetical protein